ncbi:MAG: HAD hydrolase-like protein [Candidatus Hermodarchaeota archaeon]|nr:HAD hydrolase-like protein [Candidatus Hermodarchaeota archaeon]
MNRECIWPRLQEIGVLGPYDDFNKAKDKVLVKSEYEYIAAPIKPFSEVTPFLKHIVDLMGYKDFPVDQLREIEGEGWEYLRTKVTCFPGTREALQWIRDQGLKLAVVSNWYQEMIEGYLDQLKIRHFFDTIMTSEKAGALKADLKPFQLSLDKLKVPPNRTIHIGDSIRHDGACRQLGIKYIYSTWHQAEHPEEPTLAVSEDLYDYTVATYPQLVDLLHDLISV